MSATAIRSERRTVTGGPRNSLTLRVAGSKRPPSRQELTAAGRCSNMALASQSPKTSPSRSSDVRRPFPKETLHGRHQFGRRPLDRRGSRAGDDQLSAGQRLVAGRPRRPQAGVEQAEANGAVKAIVIICDGRTFIAGADISEFGKPPAPPHSPEVARRHGERVEAGHRRDPRHGAGRRVRGRADGALPHRRPVGEMRPAGDQARHHPRRRGHATPAAAHRCREGARRHFVRDAVRRARGQGMGRRRRARRGRQAARVGDRLRPAPHR